MEAGREDTNTQETYVGEGSHPREPFLFVKSGETVPAEEAVIDVRESVDKLGDVGGYHIVLFAKVAGCCRWPPICRKWLLGVWDGWEHVELSSFEM